MTPFVAGHEDMHDGHTGRVMVRGSRDGRSQDLPKIVAKHSEHRSYSFGAGIEGVLLEDAASSIVKRREMNQLLPFST